jgi:hypothetical protein
VRHGLPAMPPCPVLGAQAALAENDRRPPAVDDGLDVHAPQERARPAATHLDGSGSRRATLASRYPQVLDAFTDWTSRRTDRSNRNRDRLEEGQWVFVGG